MTRYLLVIGAQRCGTTYLHRLLDEHPEIAMAKPARPEPKFFLDEQRWRKGLAWYEATYFAGADDVPLHGEKSTSYIESPKAALRASEMLPEADVLVMLRDPLARAVSNWRFSTASGLEDRPLEQALAENLRGPRDWDPSKASVSPFAYLERGRYADFLEPWRRAFPRTHILFIEEFAGDPEALAGLYGALKVAAQIRPPSLKDKINAADSPSGDIDQVLAKELRAYYEDSDERLRADLQRRLPWDPQS